MQLIVHQYYQIHGTYFNSSILADSAMVIVIRCKYEVLFDHRTPETKTGETISFGLPAVKHHDRRRSVDCGGAQCTGFTGRTDGLQKQYSGKYARTCPPESPHHHIYTGHPCGDAPLDLAVGTFFKWSPARSKRYQLASVITLFLGSGAIGHLLRFG